MITKKCSVCGIEKPLSEYYKHPTGKDGRTSVCKSCQIARVRASKGRKPIKYIECTICGQLKPENEFYKKKSNQRTICRECLNKTYTVPHRIKKIAQANGFPCTLLKGWTQAAIDCLEIGCNCERCTVQATMTTKKCQMKKAVKLLIQIHGKPDGCNELTVI